MTADLIAFLKRTALLSHLDDAVLRELAPELTLVSCPAGALLLREGEPGDALFLVRRGELRAVSYAPDGGEILLNTIGPGEGVGELSLLTGERRSATVYASAPSELLRLTRDQFEQLGQRHPAAMQAIAQTIARRLQQTQLNLALYVHRIFGKHDDAVLRAMSAELELVVVRGGEQLVRQGDPSDALYVIINGRLRAEVGDGQGEPSARYELRRGQTVGELGVLTGEPRGANVYAVRDSLLARLPRAGYDRLLSAFPQVMVQQFAAPAIAMLRDQANHGGQRQRPGNAVATIAVAPIDGRAPLSAFTAQLVQALSAVAPTLHVTSARLEQALARHDIAQTPPDAPASISIVRWLNEQEASYRYVIYEADPSATHWTERCLRQADRILLLGDASGPPDLGVIERALLPSDAAHRLAERSLVLVHPPETAQPSGTRRWLDARQVSAHYHIRDGRAEDMARLARLLTGRGIGVVLSGGGAAGFGHIGAIRALREAGIPIDLIGGTSMGGLMACQHAAGWDAATTDTKNRAAAHLKFDYTLPIVALVHGGRMTTVTRQMFGETQLEDMWIYCYCVTANLSRARLVVHDRGPAWKYTRATTSIPGVLPPVIDGGEMLVDGGLLNNLPTDIMRQRADCGTIFAIDASGALGGRSHRAPSYETGISGWEVLWRRINPFTPALKVPSIGQIMMRVAVINDATHVRTTRSLADYYLRLAVDQYGLLDFSNYDAIVESGYRSAQGLIAAWQGDPLFQALGASGGDPT